MITQSLDLSPLTLDKLFNDGLCLTFNPSESIEYKDIIEQEIKLKNTWVLSKIAKLAFDNYNAPFHYFSNGVLIHAFVPSKDNDIALARIEKMLFIRGYKIEKVYGPQNQIEFFAYSDFLRKISEYALKIYPQKEHIYFESIPDKKTFIETCFKNGNVLLTASKYENIPESCRSYMALFEDGSFYVSNRYKIGNSIFNPQLPKDFKFANRKYFYLQLKYIPQDYLDALYTQAKKYDWYQPKTEKQSIADEKSSAKTQKSAKEIYIEMLKQKARYLKKMLNIPHHEALETVAKMVGFNNFKEALTINESNAEYSIKQEKAKKEKALQKGLNQIEDEYKRYLRNL
ncbi:MAG: hypothetical protein IJ019_03970 [Alphaproteobacteria bacterium]|nr:hypothetical protein [Alphaproteobacteria bacterium]